MKSSRAGRGRRFGLAGALVSGIAIAALGISHFAGAAPATATAGTQEQGVLRATLPNGLRVIVCAQHAGAGRRHLGELSRGFE